MIQQNINITILYKFWLVALVVYECVDESRRIYRDLYPYFLRDAKFQRLPQFYKWISIKVEIYGLFRIDVI